MKIRHTYLPGDDPRGGDVEGHLRLDPTTDPEAAEARTRPAPELTDDEDVEGHVQPPRDLDIERY